MNHLLYTDRFIKTYAWSFFNIITRVVSQFYIIPILSKDKIEYGIYVFLIGFNFVLAYLDFGFQNLARKEGAFNFELNNKDQLSLIFSTLITVYLLIASLVFFLFIYIYFNPWIIIPFSETIDIETTKSLILVYSISIFSTFLLRFCSIYFEISIKSYIVTSLLSVIQIINTFYVFLSNGLGTFSIVDFFGLWQIQNLVLALILLYQINKKCQLKLKLNIKYIQRHKDLILNGLTLSIAWLLLSEIDGTFILKFFGPESVAIIGPALTINSFLRFGITTLLAPFTVRMFQKSGMNSSEYIGTYFPSILVIIGGVLTIIYSQSDLIISLWLGSEYQSSSIILKNLIIIQFTQLFSIIAATFFTVNSDFEKLYQNKILQLIFFWGLLSIILINFNLELNDYFSLKVIAFIIFDFWLFQNFMIKSKFNFNLKSFLKPLMVIVLILIINGIISVSYELLGGNMSTSNERQNFDLLILQLTIPSILGTLLYKKEIINLIKIKR